MLSPHDKQFIREHLTDDVRRLALRAASLSYPGMNLPFILAQIAGKQQIKNKIPSWYPLEELVFPSHLSLEQCSSETAARYKASLLSGTSFVDLTGGFGVDTAFISPKFTQAVYVEKQAGLAEIAAHNFPVLGLKNVTIHLADAVDYLQKTDAVDCIYLDPSRRSDSGKKVSLIEDCEPDLTNIQDLLLEKAGRVLIKLSPMLDIKAALKVLKKVEAVHVISIENECKELLFLLTKEAPEEPPVTCINFKKNEDCQVITFTEQEEKNAVVSYTNTLGTYLYEPNASLLKAGCYKSIALRYRLAKLHPDSHLYTSSELVSDFPGRIFRVESVSSLNKKELKEKFSSIKKAHVSVRNFPLSVAELRKREKWEEGGDIYLFASTLANGKHIIIKAIKEKYLRSKLTKKSVCLSLRAQRNGDL